VNLLFAGRDTTAATLSWAFYELASKPAVVSRLHKEIIEEIGLDAIPSLTDLKKMKYVHHVVNETLRLHPPVPVNVRYASKDVVVTGSSGRKISLRKGDAVVYSTLAMQRRADIYPPISASFPPPEEFAPERWESWVPEPWTYIPFNGGPRICVGQQFALTEMWFTIVRLLQKFERIDRGETQGEQFLKTDVVGSPGGGVKVKLW
jgi:cytochrome P450